MNESVDVESARQTYKQSWRETHDGDMSGFDEWFAEMETLLEGPPPEDKPHKDMTKQEKMAYIKRYGHLKYAQLIEDGRM